MDKEGQNLRQLTDHPSEDRYPTWLLDGKHIAFVSWFIGKRAKGKASKSLHHKDGKNLRQLTKDENDNHHPVWSTSSRQIIFSPRRTGNYEIYVMDINGANIRNLTNHPAPDYQPSYFVSSLLLVSPMENFKLTNWAEIK